MPSIADQVTDIQIVTEVLPCPAGAQITFQDGFKAILSAEHSDFDILLQHVRDTLAFPEMVGVLVDGASRVVDLKRAERATVREVKNDEDPSRLEVAFWECCPIYYLTRDHPECERILATLTAAAASGNPVWLASRTWPVEGETQIWIKLMDVRPASTAEKMMLGTESQSAGANGVRGETKTSAVTGGSSATDSTLA